MKYRSVQPYEYSANSPIMAVDPSGRDCDVVIDGDNIVVSAEYFVSHADEAAARKAVQPIANLSGTVVEYEGKKYTLTFNLKVTPVDDPIASYGEATREIDEKGELIVGVQTNANVFAVVEDQGQFEPEDAGVTSNGMYILIKSQYRDHESVGSHEVLHTLGVEHHPAGIMTKSIKDKNWSPTLFPGVIDEIVSGRNAGNAGLGRRNVRRSQ